MNKPTPDVREILEGFYYHDPDELSEDAFKPLGDDEIAEAQVALEAYIETECEKAIKNYLTKVYGERCKTKDIDDCPELKESGNNRCLTCKVWEHYDEEVKYGGKSHEQ